MNALYSTGKPCRATLAELTGFGVNELPVRAAPVCMHTWRKKFDSANKAAAAKVRTEKKK